MDEIYSQDDGPRRTMWMLWVGWDETAWTGGRSAGARGGGDTSRITRGGTMRAWPWDRGECVFAGGQELRIFVFPIFVL